MNVIDPLINPLIFIFFCYYERAHDKKRVQSWKFKTLSRIPNHDLLNQTLNNIYLSTLPAKINEKFFQNKGNALFWGRFPLREFFLRTLAKYNRSGPPAFQCKKYRVDWLSSQKLFYHYSMQKSFNESAQFIKSFVR